MFHFRFDFKDLLFSFACCRWMTFFVFGTIIGGSAITHKDVLEHINDKDLAAVASQLREVIMHSSTRRCTMDWSKQPGIPPSIPADFGDHVLGSSAFIVVHGAGLKFHTVFHLHVCTL